MQTDFTKGNEGTSILKFAYPIMIGNICMQLYNYADSVIVGRFIGKEALAAVGASTPFVFLLISLVIGISMGTTIIISQFYGAKDFVSIKRASDTLYIFLFFAAILLTIFGFTCSEWIMNIIKLPDELHDIFRTYVNIYMVGLIFLFGFNSLSAILRGVGDSFSPLKFLVFSSIVNIVLDLLFVIKFDWGIEGVAWATVISQAISFLFAVLYTNKRTKIVRLNIFDLQFDYKIFIKGIKLGLPAGIQQLLVSMGMLAIISIINEYGTDTIAAYSAAGRIESFIFVIPMSLSIALTSFTGQNYGDHNIIRIKRGLVACIKYSLIASLTLLVLLSALAEPLMRMFTTEMSVISVGCEYLYVLGVSFWMFSIMFCYTGTLRGIGNTIIPMLITLLTLWVIRVPAAHYLSSVFGTLGIWLSSSFSWGIGMILSYLYFHKKIGHLKL